MQLNVFGPKNKAAPRTHEGGPAERNSDLGEALKRTVMSCLLWEDTFYEDGEKVSERIEKLCMNPRLPVKEICAIAIDARKKSKLRHVPLLLLRYAVKRAKNRAESLCCEIALEEVIERADQVTEFMALYWKEGKSPIAWSVRRGLGAAFRKFDEYQLAKWNREAPIKLRDALFLIHAKPEISNRKSGFHKVPAIKRKNYRRGATLRHSEGQGLLWQALVKGELETPYTWEVELSGAKAAGKAKKQVWEELLRSGKLGALALIRNLRNMNDEKVDPDLIKGALLSAKADRILPYQFITAARYAPRFEREIEILMLNNLAQMEKLEGKTLLIVDTSGSMNQPLSEKGELKRVDAALGLSIFLASQADIECWAIREFLAEIPARKGFALRDAIIPQLGGGTRLGAGLNQLAKQQTQRYARVVMITDEQSEDAITRVPDCEFFFIINVGTYDHGVLKPNEVRYGEKIGALDVMKIHGFSENSIGFIAEYEKRRSNIL